MHPKKTTGPTLDQIQAALDTPFEFTWATQKLRMAWSEVTIGQEAWALKQLRLRDVDGHGMAQCIAQICAVARDAGLQLWDLDDMLKMTPAQYKRCISLPDDAEKVFEEALAAGPADPSEDDDPEA